MDRRRPTKEWGNRSRIGKQTIISGAKKLQDILGILIELTRRHSLQMPLRDKAKGREGEWRILRSIGHRLSSRCSTRCTPFSDHEMITVIYLQNGRLQNSASPAVGLPNITPANPAECGGGTNKRPLSHEREKVK